MKSVFRSCAVLFILIHVTATLSSQCPTPPNINFTNASFEGTPQAHVTPGPWSICMGGQTPDTQPGSWGVTLPPTNGSTYLGLVHQPSTGWQEGASEQLSSPFIAGLVYAFSIDLANVQTSDLGVGIIPGCAEMQVWGGFGACDDNTGSGTLLWSSGNITPWDTWVTYNVSFVPTQSYTWVMIRINSLGCTDGPYILVDNIGPFVPQPVGILSTTIDQAVACPGQSNGQSTVHAVGQCTPFTYLWSSTPAQTDSVLDNVPAGIYTVTVTDADANTATGTVTITQPAPIVLTPTIIDAGCYNTGSAYMSYTGGTWPYTSQWNNGPTTPNNSNLAPGVYTVTGTDANSCTASASITISTPPEPTISGTVTNPACGTPGSISTTAAGGTPAYTYAWNTTPVQTGAIATNLGGGTYIVTVTDVNSCTGTATFSLPPPPNLPVVSLTPVDVVCFGQNSGSIIASVSNGTPGFTFSWNTTPPQTNANATNLPAGNYTLVVTDANTCTVSASATVAEPPLLTVSTVATDVLCFSESTGSATATAGGGVPGYTYNWNSTPAQSTPAAINLPAGLFNITVTDANSCTATSSATVNQPAQPLSLTETNVDVLCFGQNTGSATVIAAGGTSGYTYNWNTTPIQNNATATSLIAGTYTVTVVDANSCSASISSVITQPATAVSVSISMTPQICFVDPPAMAIAFPVGGTPGYTFAWNTTPVQNSQSVTNLPAGTYTVTATDANSCTATASTTIVAPPSAITLVTSHVDVLCFGDATGSATVNASGSYGTYIYNWNSAPAQSTATATQLVAGTYSVTVTDIQSCSATASETVSQPATPLSLSVSPVDILCRGDATGSATVTPSGGTAGYTFNWNTTPSQNTATASALVAGTYIVTVTDANVCSASISTVISEPASAVSVTISFNPQVCFGPPSASATAVASGGTSGYTYSWNTTPVQNTATITNLSAGNYTVTATDANSCTVSASGTLASPPSQLTVSTSAVDVLCFGDATGSVTAVASGSHGNYSYTWNSNPVQTTATATQLTAGTYLLTVTDVQGCSATGSQAISQPATPLSISTVAVDVLCFGDATGSATVSASGGTTGYTYNWNSSPAQSTPTATALIAGTYVVTVTDANSCSASASSIITQPSSPLSVTIALTSPVCFGQPLASAAANASGGTAGYTYSWNTTPVQNTQTVSNLSAGSYTVTTTDANSCTATASTTVASPPTQLVLTTTPVDVLCFGDATGSATVTASGSHGNYSYNWNSTPVQTTAVATQLVAGTYVVAVTDIQGCSATASEVIAQPASALSISTSKTDVLCFGNSTGSAAVIASGGTAAYNYAWSTQPQQTTAAISSLVAGTYTVTVNDANGCSQTGSETITQPDQLFATVGITQISCNGAANGSISVTATGGTLAYAYQWSVTPSVNAPDATGLSPGSYSVTVTDANSCSTTIGNMTVTEPLALVVTNNITSVSCPGNNDGGITINCSGGTTPYTYNWNNGANTPDNINLAGGTYGITVADDNGCTLAATNLIVDELPAVSISSVVTNIPCMEVHNGTIDITVASSFLPLQIQWSNGSNQEDLSALNAGTYSVTVTDDHNCTATSTFSIVNDSVFAVDATPDTVTIALGQTVQLNVAALGSSISSVFWTPANNLDCEDCINPVSSALENITYRVTATDVNGCIATDTAWIKVIPTYEIFVPNAFTPNGDGNNDFFEVFGNKEAWKQFQVSLFNRWGEKVFESNDMNFKWDGVYQGQIMNPTVLVYLVKLVYLDNYTEKIHKGTVTLIR